MWISLELTDVRSGEKFGKKGVRYTYTRFTLALMLLRML